MKRPQFILEYCRKDNAWLVTNSETQMTASFLYEDTARGALDLVKLAPEKFTEFELTPRHSFRAEVAK